MLALKRNHEELDQKSFYGHGKKWFRGDKISKGRFGSVYLATLKKPKWRLTHLPVLMAVKSAEVSDSALLQKEAMVLNNLKGCPHIRQCFGEEITTSDSNEMIYNLLLEYSSGGTLADIIEKSGSNGLPESDVRRYTRHILEGLKCVHECGYVHCDLKPESLIIVPNISTSSSGGGTEYRVKIGDFGLAKSAKQTKKKRLDPCYYRGSVNYLSPEVVVEKLEEPPSDVWALGCVVIEMLTGKSLWDGKHDCEVEDILYEINSEGKGLPINEILSKEGKDFLKGCFAIKPEGRLTAEMLLNHPFVAGTRLYEEVEEHDTELREDQEPLEDLESFDEAEDELRMAYGFDDLLPEREPDLNSELRKY